MTVKDLMKPQVFTVAPEDMIDRVFFLLHYEKIRHLPVVEKRKVVGIVSDRDLYKALGPRSRKGAVSSGADGETTLHVRPKRVRHIMRRGVLTVEPGEDAGKAAALMAKRKIGALPVVRNTKLVGIITATDILMAFSKMRSALQKAERAG